MIDVTTKKPLHVSVPERAGPFIRLPFSQVDEVRRLLDTNGVFYWVGDSVISFDGGPEMAVIRMSKNGDADAVQAILDSVN